MKRIIVVAGLMLLTSFTVSADSDIDAMAFAAKNSFDPELVKDVEFIQGKKFKLGKRSMAYNLFFHGTVNGIKQNIKVNCKENIETDSVDYCKPVSMEPIR